MTQQVTPHFSFYLPDLCLSLLIWCFTINHPLNLVPIQNMLGSRNNTSEAYKIASEPAQLNTQRGKKHEEEQEEGAIHRTCQKFVFFKGVELPPLMPGDRVFVPSLSEWGRPGKPRSSWENQVHVVMEQKGNGMPVFEVRPESGTKQSRVLLLQRFSNSPSVYLATPHIPCVHNCKDLLGVQL